jgi:radical SAM protein with 4Fe4S-binding SPASM domain|tara:strand:- start:36 stop:902 length:867 start_codon:yes stop_codon:yes gene_type:complete
MNPSTTIKKNIKRRTLIVDENIRFYKKIPLPTWIELSLIDVCNRSCSFCPKSDPSIAPDTFQSMSRLLIDKLSSELQKINYGGAIALCGYGEPLLHKDIIYITRKLSKVSSVEIVTNGDALTSKMLKNLHSANASRVLVSMYDGPEQIKKFKKIIKNSKVPEELIILRDRWYDKDNNFGVKLTNRTGTIKIGNQVSNSTHTTCFYPSYQFLIDWNGDVFLCPQDWQRRVSMGNMMQENIFNIWAGKIITRYRKELLKGKRASSPCNTCNAQGTLLGQNHVKIWKELYK